MTAPLRLSIVSPCYQEADNIAALVRQVSSAADTIDCTWELILVNDGSSDDTWRQIAAAASDDPRVRGINLSRNFGKEAAMLAGLRAAAGDAVVILDADLQHPPTLIPTMVQTMVDQQVDQVVAHRTRDGEPWLRRSLSRLYYRIVRSLMNVSLVDGVGDFRLLSRKALDALLQLTEVDRFSKGLFAWIGFPTASVNYTNVRRTRGDSSWSLRSLLNYGIDGVIAFNDRPLRLGIHLGLTAVTLSFLYLVGLFIHWISVGVDAPGYLTTLGAIVLIGGLQISLIGLVGEYVGRIHSEVKGRPIYLVADTLNDHVLDAPSQASDMPSPAVPSNSAAGTSTDALRKKR